MPQNRPNGRHDNCDLSSPRQNPENSDTVTPTLSDYPSFSTSPLCSRVRPVSRRLRDSTPLRSRKVLTLFDRRTSSGVCPGFSVDYTIHPAPPTAVAHSTRNVESPREPEDTPPS